LRWEGRLKGGGSQKTCLYKGERAYGKRLLSPRKGEVNQGAILKFFKKGLRIFYF